MSGKEGLAPVLDILTGKPVQGREPSKPKKLNWKKSKRDIAISLGFSREIFK